MKKALSLFLFISFISMCLMLSISAAANNCVKITFTETPPDNSGWISVNAYTGKLQEGETLSVNVYNAGPDEFYCFLSTREGENWNTVGTSDFVYIEPGTSETVEISGITANAVWYLLELREISEDTVFYLQGDERADYASNLYPMSELVEGQYCTLSAAAFPAEEVVATEQPQTTAEPTATPTIPAETPEPSPSVTEAPTEDPKEIPGNVPWPLILGCAAAAVVAVALITVLIKKKQKRDSEE